MLSSVQGWDLSSRERKVLVALVKEYLEQGRPVGSRTLGEQYDLGCSAATIRNHMASLSEKGFLHQPHTSAGRIPTSEAYRFFVNHVPPDDDLSEPQKISIRNRLSQNRGEMGVLLHETSEVLSDLSLCAGVVLWPSLADAVFRRLDFIDLDAGRVLAIFISESGWVSKKIIQLEETIRQDELDRISVLLHREYRGTPLSNVRRRLLSRMRRERALYEQLLEKALKLEESGDPGETDHELYVGDLHNLIAFPEFAGPETLQSLFKAFEEKGRIVRLLNKCLENEEVQVWIGDGDLALGPPGLSLVAVPYRKKGRPLGMLGIFGPRRMPYPRIMSLVGYTSQMLSLLITPPESGPDGDQEGTVG